MAKKLIVAVLLLCIALSFNTFAENSAENQNIPAESQQVPAGGNTFSGEVPPNMPSREMPQGNFDPSKMPERNFDSSKMPQRNFDSSKMPQGNFDPSKMPQRNTDTSDMPQGGFTPPSNNGGERPSRNTNENVPTEGNGNESAWNGMQFGGEMPQGMGRFPGDIMSQDENTPNVEESGFKGFVKKYSTPITSLVLLGLAYLFVIFYKRKHY